MRTSSSRLRLGAAVASTGLLVMFSFGTPAFAGGKDSSVKSSAPSGDDDSVSDNGADDNRHPSGKDRHEDKGTQGQSQSNPDGGGADKPYGGPNGTDGSGGVDQADQDGNNGCGNDDDFEDDNNGNCGGPEKTKSDVDDDAKDKECVKASEMGQDKGKGKGLDSEKCDKDDEVKGKDKDKDKDDDTDTGTVVKVDEVKVDAVKIDAVKTESTNTVVGTTVLGSIIENGSPVVQAEAAQAAIETRVLGVSVERDTTAAVAAAPATAAPSTPTAVLGATFTRGAALARTGFGLTFLAIAGLLLILAGFGLKRSGRSTI